MFALPYRNEVPNSTVVNDKIPSLLEEQQIANGWVVKGPQSVLLIKDRRPLYVHTGNSYGIDSSSLCEKTVGRKSVDCNTDFPCDEEMNLSAEQPSSSMPVTTNYQPSVDVTANKTPSTLSEDLETQTTTPNEGTDPQTAPKKSNTEVIIMVFVCAAVLCLLGVIIYYFFIKK